jgi:hypothetical protein
LFGVDLCYHEMNINPKRSAAGPIDQSSFELGWFVS